jgi:flagellar biogenesis protein FliO
MFSPISCMCDFFGVYIGVSTKSEYRLSIILFLFLILIYILSNLMNLWADRFSTFAGYNLTSSSSVLFKKRFRI